MAPIKTGGSLSSLQNAIKQLVRGGGNVTHILNVKISRRHLSKEVKSQILQFIHNRIAGVPVTKLINDVRVTITWRTSARPSSSSYYHADVTLFTDVVVKHHTKLLFKDILGELNAQFDDIVQTGSSGLSFHVTRPLYKEVALVDND